MKVTRTLAAAVVCGCGAKEACEDHEVAGGPEPLPVEESFVDPNLLDFGCELPTSAQLPEEGGIYLDLDPVADTCVFGDDAQSYRFYFTFAEHSVVMQSEQFQVVDVEGPSYLTTIQYDPGQDISWVETEYGRPFTCFLEDAWFGSFTMTLSASEEGTLTLQEVTPLLLP